MRPKIDNFDPTDSLRLGTKKKKSTFHLQFQLGLVADPVIEAIARLEFEDGLRTVVLPGDYHCYCVGGHSHSTQTTFWIFFAPPSLSLDSLFTEAYYSKDWNKPTVWNKRTGGKVWKKQ